MITDKLLRLSDSQAVLTTAVSEKTIDLGAARDIGSGKQLFMIFTIPVAYTRAAGPCTVTFNVIIDDDAALGSPTVLAATGAISKPVLGAKYALPIPPNVGSLGLRYLGASYTISATADTGKITTDIVETLPDGAKFYASGWTV